MARTVPGSAVTHLVVVLEETHERCRVVVRAVEVNRGSPVLLSEGRPSTVVDEYLGEGFGEGFGGPEIGVVAVGLAGEERVQGVVDVVVPLHRHAARPLRDADRCDHVGPVEVRLGNEGQRTADLRGPFGDLRGQLGEDVGLGSVDEGMDGIQTKPVDPVLHQPLVGIVDDELTDGLVVVPVEIHRVAPRGRVMVIEVGAELGQVVPLRSEVVVDDVEDDPESLGMGSVDELLEAGRAAVGVLGGVQIHPVVSPAASAGDLGDRHDLDGLHPEFDEVVEAIDGGGEGALLGEGADVHLVEHSSLEV